MKTRWNRSQRRSRGPHRRRHSLGQIERLESRQVMDGSTPQLGANEFAVHMNDDPTRLEVLNRTIWNEYSGARKITSVSFPTAGGVAEITSDGNAVSFRPSTDFSGSDTFSIVVDDQFVTQVVVHVDSPLRSDEATAHPTEMSTLINLLANDPFWVGYIGDKRVTAVSASELGGTITIAVDGKSVQYQPPSDTQFVGHIDHFSYIVDGKYTADVSVSIVDPLKPGYLEIMQESAETLLPALATAPFWPGYDGARKITSATGIVDGAKIAISDDGQSIRYKPAPGFRGWDNVRFVVDGKYSTIFQVNVLAAVSDDWFSADENGDWLECNVLANDVFWRDNGRRIDSIAQKVTSVSTPDHGGRVEIAPGGHGVRYRPAANFVGTEQFAYLVDSKYLAKVIMSVTRPV